MVRTPAWNYSKEVFAGSAKNMLVKRRPKSRPATALPKIRHKLNGPASGKTLIRFRRGNGEKRNVQPPRDNTV